MTWPLPITFHEHSLIQPFYRDWSSHLASAKINQSSSLPLCNRSCHCCHNINWRSYNFSTKHYSRPPETNTRPSVNTCNKLCFIHWMPKGVFPLATSKHLCTLHGTKQSCRVTHWLVWACHCVECSNGTQRPEEVTSTCLFQPWANKAWGAAMWLSIHTRNPSTEFCGAFFLRRTPLHNEA